MYYKKIDGKNIYLSPIWLGDTERYYNMKISDDELAKIVFEQYKQKNFDLEDAYEELKDFASSLVFSIVSKDNDKLVGYIGLSNILPLNQRCDMWIKMFVDIDYDYQVQYGSQSINLLTEYCYNILNLHSIVLKTPAFNRQAIDICLNSKTQYLGTRSASEKYSDNKFYNTIYFQCTPFIYESNNDSIVPINCEGIELNISNNDETNMSNTVCGNRISLVRYSGIRDYVSPITVYLNDPRVAIPIGEYKDNWTNLSLRKELSDKDYIILLNDKVLGYINLFRKDYFNKTADLEILIGNVEEHHKGYGKEALRLFLDEHYKNGPFNNILSCVFEFNQQSMRLHKSLDYQFVGIRKEAYFANGKLNDMHMYEMTQQIHSQKTKIR